MNLLQLFLRANIGRTRKTVLLALLLLGIMMLPLFPLCLYDSSQYGLEQMAISYTNDSHFMITLCTEQDLARFDGLEHCAVWFENDTIYIKYLLPFTEEAHQALKDDLFSILIHCDDGVPRGLSDVSQVREGYRYDTTPSRPYAVLTALFVPLSAVMLCAAIRSHVLSFRRQVGILYALGGTYRQARGVLMQELLLLLTLSAAAAYGLVFATMKLLYRLFLQVDGAFVNACWSYFYVNPGHFCGLLGGFLLLGLAAAMLQCRRYRAQEPLRYMKTEAVLRHPSRPFHLRRNGGVLMLLALWQKRYRNLYAVSTLLMAAILGASAAMLLFAQVKSNIQEPEFDVSIQRTVSSAEDRQNHPAAPQFSERDLQILSAVDGVEQLQFDRVPTESNLYLHLKGKAAQACADLEPDGVPCISVILRDADTLPPTLERPDGEQVLLYGSWAATFCGSRSRIELSSVEYLREEVYDENGEVVTISTPRLRKTRSLTVQALIGEDDTMEKPVLYLSHALYEELCGSIVRPGRAFLRLSDHTRSAEVAAMLQKSLPGEFYHITDHYGGYLAALHQTRGELLLAMLILTLTAAITWILHTLFAGETFTALRPSVGILLHIGASARQIRCSFRLQAYGYAMLAAVIGAAGGTGAALLYYRANPAISAITPAAPVLLLLAALTLINIATYMLPIAMHTQKITQEEI